MSDKGPFAVARSRTGSESALDATAGIDKTGDKAESSRYDFRGLFNILLIAFSAVPTAIFLAWIISWSIVILYLCTFGFAVGVACVTGLSMFIYGPVLCFCLISAFGCSLVYNVARYTWDLVWETLYTVRRILYQLLAPPGAADAATAGVITKRGAPATQQGGEMDEPTWWPLLWLRGGGGEGKEMAATGEEGWGPLREPTKEPERWGTQPLQEKFGTRQAAPKSTAATPGGGQTRPMSTPGPGLLSGAVGGYGGRKGNVRPEEVHPYQVR
ncbi:hypothetical protein BGX23_006535 [Mortierella sp. AD031]|nr:hypothetical protein BGX23_006535 [Mortierella sp. AD031]